jgi:hypothetical protein
MSISSVQRPLSVLVLAVVLSACGSSDSSPGAGDKKGCGSSSASGKTTCMEDTPRTRLAAVRAHPDFSQLIQTPKCDAGAKSVRSTTYIASYVYRVKTESGFEFSCDAKLQILIDTRTSMLKLLERCPAEGYSYHLATSRYAILDNQLTIDGFGTIALTSGKRLQLDSPRSGSGKAGLVRIDERDLGVDGGAEIYSLLCE